jgi:hypothetical protein
MLPEVTMARMPQSGSGVFALREDEITLHQVLHNAGLTIPADKEEEIRSALMEIHCCGLIELAASPASHPRDGVQVEDVIRTLKRIAGHLREVEPPLRGTETGLRNAHDLEVAKAVQGVLIRNPGLAPVSWRVESLGSGYLV